MTDYDGYFDMDNHFNEKSEVEKMLDKMNNHELAEILLQLVGTDEEINELVERALKKQMEEKPCYVELRKSISLFIADTSDSYDDAEDYMELLGIFDLKGYLNIKYKGKQDDFRYCLNALEKANSSCEAFDAFRNILLLCRMLKHSRNWKCEVILADLETEYLPGMLRTLLDAMDPKEQELLLRWGVDFEEDKDYGLLAKGFLKIVDDESQLQILKRIRLGYFENCPYFDRDLFKQLAEVMVALEEWDEIIELSLKYLDEWDVAKILGDMYFKREMYEDALKYYRIYYDQLYRDENWSCIDDLLEFLYVHISCFKDTETLREMYENVVMTGRIAFLHYMQALYRLTPEEGKDYVKRRFLEVYGDGVSEEYRLRVFRNDAEIMDLYRKGKVSRKDLGQYCGVLDLDWMSFSHEPGDIKDFASLVEACFYDILVKEDLECRYNLRNALEELYCNMGDVGRAEAERIVGRLPEITVFYKELDKFFSECEWYRELKRN